MQLVHLNNVVDELHPIMANVIQPAWERWLVIGGRFTPLVFNNASTDITAMRHHCADNLLKASVMDATQRHPPHQGEVPHFQTLPYVCA